jgi:hypothetical protein
VFVQPQPDPQEWSGFTVGKAEAVLPMPKRAVDLLIAAEGRRPVTVRGARGDVEVTLEEWPGTEVRFLGAEALAAGAMLRASGRPPAETRHLRYRVAWGAGDLDYLLRPRGNSVLVKDGVATLVIGEGAARLSVWVQLEERGRALALKQVTPSEIFAGAPITVQLSADEIRAAVESLQQADAKK